MDKVLAEFKNLSDPFIATALGNHFYTDHCGYRRFFTLHDRMSFVFDFRKWDKIKHYNYKYIQSIKGTTYSVLPKHYFYTELIPELPYRLNNILFWIWILKHYLDINELRLKIVYWIFITSDGQSD